MDALMGNSDLADMFAQLPGAQKYFSDMQKLIKDKVVPMARSAGERFKIMSLSSKEFKVINGFEALANGEIDDMSPMQLLGLVKSLNKVVKPVMLMMALDQLGLVNANRLTVDLQESQGSCSGGGDIVGVWN